MLKSKIQKTKTKTKNKLKIVNSHLIWKTLIKQMSLVKQNNGINILQRFKKATLKARKYKRMSRK